MKKYSNIFYISGSYISVLLGAGFISGQELMFFFGKFGNIGFIGLWVACFLFAIVGFKQLYIVKKLKILNYKEFTNEIMENNLALITENMSLLFILVLMSTMLSAGGATVNEAFGIGYNIGVLLFALVVLLVLMLGVNGVVLINSILAPIMLVGGIAVGIYTYSYNYVPTFNIETNVGSTKVGIFYILISSIIYMSYNSITSVSLMANMYKYIEDTKTIVYSCVVSCLLMITIGSSLLLSITKYQGVIEHLQIPILGLLDIDTGIIRFIYLLILILAIFTTIISCGISIINTISKNSDNRNILLKILLIFLAMILSKIGFSNFVSKVYPIFGFFGLIQVVKILTFKVKRL